jgi:hypothetical protein
VAIFVVTAARGGILGDMARDLHLGAIALLPTAPLLLLSAANLLYDPRVEHLRGLPFNH